MDVVAKSAPSPRKTKRRGRHPDKALSAAFVRSAPPGRHADGNGLYRFVQPTGTRSWVQRLVIRGRRRELGLGAAKLVPLAKAREQALANRMLARSGGDPLSEKRRVQGVPTFAEAAQRVLEQKRGGWRGRWHAQNWWRSMERYVFPRIGSLPVSEVNTADVLEILSPIWHVKAATAREVRQRIRSVLEWSTPGPRGVRRGGVFSDDDRWRHSSVTTFLAKFTVEFPAAQGRLYPYLTGGGGLGHVAGPSGAPVVALPGPLFPAVWSRAVTSSSEGGGDGLEPVSLRFPWPAEDYAQTGLSLTRGGGLDVGLWRGLALGVEVRWLRVLLSREDFDAAQVASRVSYRF